MSAMLDALLAELASDEHALDLLAGLLCDRLIPHDTNGARVDPDAWLDVEGAARYLACPTSRIYDLCRHAAETGFPFHKDGRRSYFRARELDDWRVANGAAPVTSRKPTSQRRTT